MTSLNQMPSSYNEFLLQNRKYINASFLYIILTCIFTGPAIGLGIYAGIFTHTSYGACVIISVGMIMLYFGCLYMYKKWPYKAYTSFLAIFVMNILLVYMSYEKISVRVTWFLMPLLSMLLLSTKFYIISCLFNYVMILLSIWLAAPYMSAMNVDESALDYFKYEATARTIETFIMAVVGYEIGQLVSFYYRSLIEEKQTVSAAERQMEKQVLLLESMNDLYDKVNYIDFQTMKEQSFHENEVEEYDLDFSKSTHSHMTQSMLEFVPEESKNRFLWFTDLQTIQERLIKNKTTFAEFTNTENEWYRLQYLMVDSDENGLPTKIIFTVQNIDDDKQKENELLKMALTDELTKLGNRRCLDLDVAEFNRHPIPDNICVMSFDLNGLKITNDTWGHRAGDELIKGAVQCIQKAMELYGKLYRTGGDEFVAIIFARNFRLIEKAIIENAESWRGENNNRLALSIGVASRTDYPDASIAELQKISDEIMYKNKEEYYKENGIDRNALYNKFQEQ